MTRPLSFGLSRLWRVGVGARNMLFWCAGSGVWDALTIAAIILLMGFSRLSEVEGIWLSFGVEDARGATRLGYIPAILGWMGAGLLLTRISSDPRPLAKLARCALMLSGLAALPWAIAWGPLSREAVVCLAGCANGVAILALGTQALLRVKWASLALPGSAIKWAGWAGAAIGGVWALAVAPLVSAPLGMPLDAARALHIHDAIWRLAAVGFGAALAPTLIAFLALGARAARLLSALGFRWIRRGLPLLPKSVSTLFRSRKPSQARGGFWHWVKGAARAGVGAVGAGARERMARAREEALALTPEQRAKWESARLAQGLPGQDEGAGKSESKRL